MPSPQPKKQSRTSSRSWVRLAHPARHASRLGSIHTLSAHFRPAPPFRITGLGSPLMFHVKRSLRPRAVHRLCRGSRAQPRSSRRHHVSSGLTTQRTGSSPDIVSAGSSIAPAPDLALGCGVMFHVKHHPSHPRPLTVRRISQHMRRVGMPSERPSGCPRSGRVPPLCGRVGIPESALPPGLAFNPREPVGLAHMFHVKHVRPTSFISENSSPNHEGRRGVE